MICSSQTSFLLKTGQQFHHSVGTSCFLLVEPTINQTNHGNRTFIKLETAVIVMCLDVFYRFSQYPIFHTTLLSRRLAADGLCSCSSRPTMCAKCEVGLCIGRFPCINGRSMSKPRPSLQGREHRIEKQPCGEFLISDCSTPADSTDRRNGLVKSFGGRFVV